MLPFEIPAGTTLESLLTDVVPAAHARLVPQTAGREAFTCAIELEGLGQWVVTLDGAKMTVRAGDEKAPDARIRARAEDAQAFLDDYTGDKRLAPKTRRAAPGGGAVVMLSDPRVLKRIKMVNGAVELAIADFDDGRGGAARRAWLSAALGAQAKKVEPDADVTVEVTMKTFLRLVSGGATPEEALADGDVPVKGKRLVAMQVAFALAPLFPPKAV
jgi:hypothetical protein